MAEAKSEPKSEDMWSTVVIGVAGCHRDSVFGKGVGAKAAAEATTRRLVVIERKSFMVGVVGRLVGR